MYYNYQNVISRNSFLNFIVGSRGVGKTYGLKKIMIKDFLKNGSQFVYLRRYKTELSSAMSDFFAGLIANNEFEGHKFTATPAKGKYILKCDGKVMGYGIALSTALTLKSSEFPIVRTICYDEFLIEKGAYHMLPNEPHKFLDLIETIARLRDDMRVFLLGNAITSQNAYFAYFDISMPYNSQIKTFKDGEILINYIKNEEYEQEKKNSRFGKIIDGTEYGSYAIDNKWLYDSNVFLGKRPENSKFYFTIKIGGEFIGVWNDYRENRIYISKAYNPQCPIIFALSENDHDNSTRFIKARNSTFFKSMIDHYRNGLLYFENQKIKQLMMPIIAKYLT